MILRAIARTVHSRFPGNAVRVWYDQREEPSALYPFGPFIIKLAEPSELRKIHIQVVGLKQVNITSAKPRSCCAHHFKEDVEEITEGLDQALKMMDLGDTFLEEMTG